MARTKQTVRASTGGKVVHSTDLYKVARVRHLDSLAAIALRMAVMRESTTKLAYKEEDKYYEHATQDQKDALVRTITNITEELEIMSANVRKIVDGVRSSPTKTKETDSDSPTQPGTD